MDATNGNAWKPVGPPVVKNLKVTFQPGTGISSKTGELYHQCKLSDDEGYISTGILIRGISYAGRVMVFGNPLPKE